MANWYSSDEIKEQINEIRDLTGDSNRVYLITITEADCPSCEYNEVTHESKDSSCVTCGGSGKLPTESSVSLLAKIRWVNEIEANLMKIGYLPRGGVTITIDNTYESNIDNLTPIDRVEVDGIEIRIKGKKPKGYKKVNRTVFYAEPISLST